MADDITINIVDNPVNVTIGLSTTPDNFQVNAFPGGATWGNIIGTLSAQTDLWSQLSAKALQVDLQTLTTFVQTNSSQWDESGDIIPTVVNYLSTNSVLLCSLNVNGTILSAGTDLFDIFITSAEESQTLTYNTQTELLSISNGNFVSLASLNDKEYVHNNFFPLTGGIISGPVRVNNNLTVFGNLTASGTTTFANTVFSTTSALSVVHVGSGPAVWVGNFGDGDIASFYDIDQGVEVLHIGGNNGTFPNVGVKTSVPNKDFTVKGEISASNIIYDQVGNSNQWNQAFNVSTIVQNNSASWEESADILPTVTNYLSTNRVLLSALTITNTLSSINSLTIAGNISGNNLRTSFNLGSATGDYSFAVNSGRAAGNYSQAAGFNAIAGQNFTYIWSDGNLGTTTRNVSTTRAGQYMVSASGGVFIPGIVGIGVDGFTPQLSTNRLTVAGTISSLNSGTSQQWYSTYLTVTALSSNWNTAFSCSTAVSVASANWQSTYTTVCSNSAYWTGNLQILRDSDTILSASRFSTFLKPVSSSNIFTYSEFTSGLTITIYFSGNHTIPFRQYFPSNTFFNNAGESNYVYTFPNKVTKTVIQNVGNTFIGTTNIITTNVRPITATNNIILDGIFGFLLAENQTYLQQETI